MTVLIIHTQSRLRVLGASKRQTFLSPGLFVLRPFCPTAFLSTSHLYGGYNFRLPKILMESQLPMVCQWLNICTIIMFTNPSCTQSLPCPRHARLCSSRSFPSGGHCQTMLRIQCLVGFLHGSESSATNSLHSPQHTPRLLHYRSYRHHELYR